MTNIEWTTATWNPIVGCSIVSPGCTHCYAMKMAGRLEAMSQAHEASNGGDPGPLVHYRDTTKYSKAGWVWTGKLALAPDNIITKPLRRKKPTTYFVNSMGDLFHEDVPDDWIDRVFAVMALSPQHTYQVLTKRSARMRDYCRSASTAIRVLDRMFDVADLAACLAAQAGDPRPYEARPKKVAFMDDPDAGWPLPNVWLGVSAERQTEAEARIPDLLATPAAVRFVSAEPLLGPIDFRGYWTYCPEHDFAGGFCIGPCPDRRGIDWIIVGGESGPGARPMEPDWARDIRDQCRAAGVSFFMKQMNKKTPIPDDLLIREWPVNPPTGQAK